VNRAFDAAAASLGLAVASPFLAVAALAIKFDDGGPVLYRQRRVGLGGEEFELVKLRTMDVGAERQGAGFAVNEGDPRITRAGRMLRRLSLDELPQLWNVVRGDMSLVGPRPTLAYQVERYTPRQRRRLEVRPGITGWAQIHGRARLPWEDRIELDVWYVEHRSPWLDLKIIARTPRALFAGIAAHSVRAVPLPYLKTIVAFANEHELPVHMHVAEQPAEVSACIEEYGRSPVALLDTEGLLSARFTAVHAIHVTPKAIGAIARAGAMVCACPTTERNLGDGIVPVDAYFNAGVRVSLGTDSQAQIDLLEDARELEYHLRLQKMERSILAPRDLFDCATTSGARSIGFGGGRLAPGAPADFFTVDLDDPSLAGSSTDDLLANIVFSLSRSAVRDVVVAGKRIVEDGRHREQEAIIEKFSHR